LKGSSSKKQKNPKTYMQTMDLRGGTEEETGRWND
jgi:hypothetical protein